LKGLKRASSHLLTFRRFSFSPFQLLALNPKSILIIKRGPLGGIVHALPAVALVREGHPDAEITWVINPELAPVLRGNPDVRHVHLLPRGELRGLGAAQSLLGWLKRTRELQPDLALDFDGLLYSALIAKRSGAKEVWGLSNTRTGAAWFYNRVAQSNRSDHPVERYLKLAECTGATVGESLRCSIPSGDPLPRFDAHPAFVLLHPFAARQDKSLSNRIIEEFCRALAPTRVIIVGQSRSAISTPENCVDLTRQTSLLQLIWLIRVARFVVSVESGPMHIAAAVTKNLLSIHTWSDPRRVGPYNPDAWIWKHGELFRIGDFESVQIRKHGRRFRRKDVAPVVDLIRPLVPIDPMAA
jgi:ADP-heptose:LPS heptosyltransferase